MRTAAVIGILLVGLGLRVGWAVEQPAAQPPDARAYARIAESLYLHGSFDARLPGASHEAQPSSAYSPGLPLFVAAVYLLSGGVHLTAALVLLALLGAAAIPMAYLLGRRFAGPAAGLIAAAAVAAYPALLEYQGLLLTEPLAAFLLGAALVLFFRACDRASSLWRWAGFGATFGALTMVRPEYLALAALLPLVWLLREARRGRLRRALTPLAVSLLATALALAPWTIRNAVVLGRLVPVSTGGGKALYVGTYLPADGDYQRVKALLVERYRHRRLPPGSAALERINPTPLFDRVAARYPELPRDSALGKVGKQDFSKYFGEDPLGYLAMTVRKVWRMWSAGVGEAMGSAAGRAIQVLIVLLGLAGLALLAVRRRWWELLAMATPLAIVTIVGAISLATPRRNEIPMTLVFPLAAAALVTLGAAISSRWPWFSPKRESSPAS